MPTELTTSVVAVRLSGAVLTKFVAYCDTNALSPSDAMRDFLETGLALGVAPTGRRAAADVRRVMLALAKRMTEVSVEIGERTQWQPAAMLAEVEKIGRGAIAASPRRSGG